MNLSVSLLRLLFQNYRQRCRIDVPARKKKVWFDFHQVLYHLSALQSSDRTLLFVICIQINLPLLISNNSCFRENFNSFLFFFCLFVFELIVSLLSHDLTLSALTMTCSSRWGRFTGVHFCLSYTLSCFCRWSWSWSCAVGAGWTFWLTGREKYSETPAAANWTQGRPADLKDGFTPWT